MYYTIIKLTAIDLVKCNESFDFTKSITEFGSCSHKSSKYCVHNLTSEFTCGLNYN